MSSNAITELRPPVAAAAPGRPVAQRLLWLLAAAGIGLVALAGVVALGDADYKVWVVVIAAVLSLPLVVVIKQPRLMLLFGWVMALSYNRQYFVFESFVGYHGTSGPYVILADVCFAGLLGLWVYERVRRVPSPFAGGRSFWPWFLPFAIACLLSAFAAERVDWVFFEMIRIVKMGLLLAYIRYNFGRAEVLTCVLALSVAVSFQSAVAIKEVATQRQGVIGSQDLAQESGAEDLADHFEGGKFYGMIRGVGTLAHPPYLSCFLLLGMPPMLALALSGARRRAVPAAIGFLLACGGLICTLSRGPWVIALLEGVIVVAALAAMRVLPVKQALGLTVLALFIAGAAAWPLQEKIISRMEGDLDESMEYRKTGMKASLAAFEDRPLLGVGLNNTKLYFHQYLPAFDWAFSTEAFASRTLHLRAPVAFGNGFLKVLEETGAIGLAAFLVFITGALLTAVWSIANTSGEPRLICLGLLAGMIGALAEQVIDTPLWVDPNLYIFTLFAGTVCIAPYAFRDRRSGEFGRAV